jgi:spore coat polysaccharide biosynthesis predicted glycosyltransferase SpsG
LETEVLVNVDDMARRMVDSDLLICAGGGTVWESCCLGLPPLIVVLADNQWSGARALAAGGAAILLGGIDAVAGNLSAALAQFADPTRRRRMSDAASNVTDGQGAEKIARYLAEGCL